MAALSLFDPGERESLCHSCSDLSSATPACSSQVALHARGCNLNVLWGLPNSSTVRMLLKGSQDTGISLQEHGQAILSTEMTVQWREPRQFAVRRGKPLARWFWVDFLKVALCLFDWEFKATSSTTQRTQSWTQGQAIYPCIIALKLRFFATLLVWLLLPFNLFQCTP